MQVDLSLKFILSPFRLERIRQWTDGLKLRHEFELIGRKATVEVLRDVAISNFNGELFGNTCQVSVVDKMCAYIVIVCESGSIVK